MEKHAEENVLIEYTPAGWDYVRKVLGTRPYDEAGPVIAEMERMRAEQQAKPQQGPKPLPPGVAEVPPGALAALTGALNGMGAPGAAGVAA